MSIFDKVLVVVVWIPIDKLYIEKNIIFAATNNL